MSDSKRDQFEEEIAAVRIRTGTAEAEQRWTLVGLAALIVGAAVALVAFVMSGGQSDTRDVISSVILALFGLSLSVVGRPCSCATRWPSSSASGSCASSTSSRTPSVLAPDSIALGVESGARSGVGAGYRIEPSSLRAARRSQSMPMPSRISSVCWPCSGAVASVGETWSNCTGAATSRKSLPSGVVSSGR